MGLYLPIYRATPRTVKSEATLIYNLLYVLNYVVFSTGIDYRESPFDVEIRVRRRLPTVKEF